MGRNTERGGRQRGAGRDRNEWEGAERWRSEVGRNPEAGPVVRLGVRIGMAGREERGDRREGWRGERRDVEGDRQDRNGRRSNSASTARPPQGRGLGFKALEELSLKDPSVVAITMSSHPSVKDLLSETKIRQDLIELICLVLSKAFKSRTDRGTQQHLAGIIKDSGFFCTSLPHYLAGMVSDSKPARRAQYPQHLENILVILSQVNKLMKHRKPDKT